MMYLLYQLYLIKLIFVKNSNYFILLSVWYHKDQSTDFTIFKIDDVTSSDDVTFFDDVTSSDDVSSSDDVISTAKQQLLVPCL